MRKYFFVIGILVVLSSFSFLKKSQKVLIYVPSKNYLSDTFICGSNVLPNLDSIKHITYLDLYDPTFGNLPSDIGRLENLRVLTLATNVGMTKIPKEISELKNLEQLIFIKAFKISTLPDEICELKNLTNLTIAWGGKLQAVPDSIGNLQNLTTLDLGYNRLTTLPESIKNLKKLKTLVLWANPISETELDRIKKLVPNATIYFDKPYGY